MPRGVVSNPAHVAFLALLGVGNGERCHVDDVAHLAAHLQDVDGFVHAEEDGTDDFMAAQFLQHA